MFQILWATQSLFLHVQVEGSSSNMRELPNILCLILLSHPYKWLLIQVYLAPTSLMQH